MDMLGQLAEMYGDDESAGEDMMGEGEEMGARRRARRGQPNWLRRQENSAPGAPAVSEQMIPLAVTTIVFSLTAALRQTALGTPQVAFRGERVLANRINSGTTAPLRTVTITDIKVGSRSQLAGIGGGLPVEAFAPGAFGVRLAVAPCAPGILIGVDLACDVAPTTTDTITIASAIFGRAAA